MFKGEHNFRTNDNPNPDAKIGFFCWSPFHYYVYKNIYKNLQNAEFIVGENRYFDEGLAQKNLANIISFLDQKCVKWRLYDKNALLENRLNFFQKYKAVVSVWSLPAYWQGLLEGILKIRALYGNAKDLYNFGSWSADFDMILSYGEYSQKYLSIFTISQIVGNPKFDDWFSGETDKEIDKYTSWQIDPQKKTILYMPTHDTQKGMSSLPAFLEEYTKQSRNFNFLVKLHYLTGLDEPDSLEKLRKFGCICFDETADILPLLKICDFVLSDNSGAIFDAILAKKQIILFETDEDIFKPELFEGKRGITGFTTYPESLEQKIKKTENMVGPVIRSLNDLQRAIIKSQTNSVFYQKNAEKIRNIVFGYQDGQCGKRAASAITNLIENFDRLANDYPWPYYTAKRDKLINTGKRTLIKKLPLLKKIRIFFDLYFD